MSDTRKNVQLGYTITMRWTGDREDFHDETSTAFYAREMNVIEMVISAAKSRGVDIARVSSLEVVANGAERWDSDAPK